MVFFNSFTTLLIIIYLAGVNEILANRNYYAAWAHEREQILLDPMEVDLCLITQHVEAWLTEQLVHECTVEFNDICNGYVDRVASKELGVDVN